MFKILICYGLIYTITGLPQPPYYYGTTPKDVEIFDPRFVSKPKPYPPWSGKRKPKTTTVAPIYPTSDPNSNQEPTSTKKSFVTTKVPPVYPWTSKKSINFPTPIYPYFGSHNPPFTTTSQRPPTFTTRANANPSNRWPVTPAKAPFFPTSTQRPSWQAKYPSTVGSGTSATPPWIYPPRPSWPRPYHSMVTGTNRVTEAVHVNVEDSDHFLTGSISEYQAYNEDDGSFKLGFELRNGLSAKVHGYKKNGKLVLEGSFSIFTEDGKPVNIIYKADENNYRDNGPTIFHLNIPPFDDQSNLDDENDDDVQSVPTYVPYHSNSSKILTVAETGDDDAQFSDFILQPTTQASDDEAVFVTETSG